MDKRYYFVDEAGDSNIFGKRGRVLIGTEGCSRFFMMGFLEADDPTGLSLGLNILRQELLSDPYLRKVPSMQVKNQKTALVFHAKDDSAEVRYAVYKFLMRQNGLRFSAVVRDKLAVLKEVQTVGERYQPNVLYDKTVTQLFQHHLHQPEDCKILFASRGNKDRTQALKTALEATQRQAKAHWGIETVTELHVGSQLARYDACLQVADYFLWALQRLYEKREDRYIDFVWPVYQWVYDVDDIRQNSNGVRYTQEDTLNLEKIKPLD